MASLQDVLVHARKGGAGPVKGIVAPPFSKDPKDNRPDIGGRQPNIRYNISPEVARAGGSSISQPIGGWLGKGLPDKIGETLLLAALGQGGIGVVDALGLLSGDPAKAAVTKAARPGKPLPPIPAAAQPTANPSVPTDVGGFAGFPTQGGPGQVGGGGQVQPSLIQVPGIPDNSKAEQGLFSQANRGFNLNDYLAAAGPLASQYVNPAIQGQLAAGAQGANTIAQYNRGAVEALKGLQGDISGYYNDALGLQGAISQGIGKSFNALDNTGRDLAALQNINAPASQQAELQAQNQASGPVAGNVLAGIGNLGASSLAAQKAAQMTYGAELPALLGTAGTQALGNLASSTQAALAKIYATEGPLALKIATAAMTGDQKQAATAASLFKAVTGNDLRAQGIQAGIAKSNAAEIGKTNRANASNALSAQRNSISQFRANISAFRAQHPDLYRSNTQVANDVKELSKWHDGVASTTTRTTKSPLGTTNSGSRTVSQQPISYQQALERKQASHPDWTPDQVAGFVNSAYQTYGDGGRPLDPPQIEALLAAGLSPSYQTGVGKIKGKRVNVFYLTKPQADALQAKGVNPQMQPVKASDGSTHYLISVG